MTEFHVPLEPDRTAAVFVDVQNDFVHPEGGLPETLGYETARLERGAERMAAFLAEWRALDQPVVHVRTHQSDATDSTMWAERYPGRDVDICTPGTWGAEIYDGLEPEEGEHVVTKHRYSGFADTNMDLLLRTNDIETVVMCGCLSHVCVEATGRDAFHNDYWVAFASDACATTGAYEDLHEATLANMDQFYGDVATTAEILAAVEQRAVASA